jgi:hypothetical protein
MELTGNFYMDNVDKLMLDPGSVLTVPINLGSGFVLTVPINLLGSGSRNSLSV